MLTKGRAGNKSIKSVSGQAYWVKRDGGKVEVLLFGISRRGSGRRCPAGFRIKGRKLWFSDKLTAKVIEGSNDEGVVKLKFSLVGDRLQTND